MGENDDRSVADLGDAHFDAVRFDMAECDTVNRRELHLRSVGILFDGRQRQTGTIGLLAPGRDSGSAVRTRGASTAPGRSWAELIDETYVQPCGLDVLAFNNHYAQIGTAGFDYPTPFNGDPSTLFATENPNMEGGAFVTTGDYGKLLLMHLRDGFCDETRVLSAEAVDRMHRDRIMEVYEGEAFDAGTGYGMGWWVDRDGDYISDSGAYGSVPWLDLDDGYGAYLVIEATSQAGGALAGRLYDLVEAAVTGS